MTGVTLFVPTKNREAIWKEGLVGEKGHLAYLDSLKGIDEVVVVDDFSTDCSGSVLKDGISAINTEHGRAKFKLVTLKNGRGLADARNVGIAAASGNKILFADDDVLPFFPDRWATELTKPLENGAAVSCGAVYTEQRPELVKYGTKKYRRFRSFPYLHSDGVNGAVEELQETDHVPGGNCAIRRDFLFEVNGFDPSFNSPSLRAETLLCNKLKKYGKIVIVPGAEVLHLRVDYGGCRDEVHNGDEGFNYEVQRNANTVGMLKRVNNALTAIPSLISYAGLKFVDALRGKQDHQHYNLSKKELMGAFLKGAWRGLVSRPAEPLNLEFTLYTGVESVEESIPVEAHLGSWSLG